MANEKHLIIASDHAGFALKQHLIPFLQKNGFTVDDLGTNSTDSVDYPDFGQKAAKAILDKQAPLGIVICGTGIGISIAANRFNGIRCALCTDPDYARLSRQHNDANLLALSGRLMTPEEAEAVAMVFLTTEFEGGRHQGRIQKLDHTC
jgi:ribose 5-phosphate isomerase B